ncbi:MAG: hypothetical protein EB139_05770 [Burkholderiaceae bacterium]|nr:hypothetical protein [Burkholderiaceae bacterium]
MNIASDFSDARGGLEDLRENSHNPMALYGVLRAGFIVVSINPLYTPRELAAQLRDCGAEAILLLEHFGKTLEDAFVLEGKSIALKHHY